MKNTHPSAENRGAIDRRSFLLASGVVATAVVAGSQHAQSQTAPPSTAVEGFFIVFNEPGFAEDRIFFIPSRWLEVFEITDLYQNSAASTQIANQIRSGGAHGQKPRARLLYGDIADTKFPVPGATVLVPETPSPTRTYLAAMMTDVTKIP